MIKINIEKEYNKKRLDFCLSEMLPDISRNQLKRYIEEGCVVLVNNSLSPCGRGNVRQDKGEGYDENLTSFTPLLDPLPQGEREKKIVTSPAQKVKTGEVYIVTIPEIKEAIPKAQNIPLDIVYEDDDVLVINKNAGMVVHPAAGNYDGTLVNAILFHCKDSLSGIGGVQRPGIVHRLDKDTSGLMIVAKNDKAHKHLSKQLESRKLSRLYSAIVWGNPSPSAGEISTNIGRSKTNRKKMSVLGEDAGKEAITNYKTIKTFMRKLCLVECKLQTGRTHQIRVHMTHIGCPLLGDPVYGRSKINKFKFDEEVKNALKNFPRQALHAKEISFIHPSTKEQMTFSCDMPEDMQKIIDIL